MVVMSTVVITQWVVQHGLMGSRPSTQAQAAGVCQPLELPRSWNKGSLQPPILGAGGQASRWVVCSAAGIVGARPASQMPSPVTLTGRNE